MFYYLWNILIIIAASVGYHKFQVYRHAKYVDAVYSQYNIRPFKYDEVVIPHEAKTYP